MELVSVYWMMIALKHGPIQLVATELCPSRLGHAMRQHLAGFQQLALSMTAHVCLSGADSTEYHSQSRHSPPAGYQINRPP